jgi:hypothetical protein
MMQLRKGTLPIVVSMMMLWCTVVVPTVGAQSQRAPQAVLKLVRIEPAGHDVVLVFRVPETLELSCPLQLRIGDFSANFREVPSTTGSITPSSPAAAVR